MAMNVYVNSQPPPSPAVIAVHSNQWSTGICDCFDDLGVCMSVSLQNVFLHVFASTGYRRSLYMQILQK